MDYDIEQHTWGEVRERVGLVNQELADIIDKISPHDSFKLYSVNYRYGQIIDDGTFSLPEINSFKTVKINDASISQAVKDDLITSELSLPAGVILEGSVELFMEHSHCVIPQFIYKQGDVFSFWRKLEKKTKSFHPSKLMKIKAGARSTFLLPNINDYAHHSNLINKFGISNASPKTLKEQSNLFCELVNHVTLRSPWRTKILFFSKKWISSILNNDKNWTSIKTYLFEKLWRQTGYLRNSMYVDYALSIVRNVKNIKYNQYANETLKQIIAIASGSSPGFSVADNELMIPLSLIQKIYADVYDLSGGTPIIFIPDYFNIDDSNTNKNIYYSLQFPTIFDFAPKSAGQVSTLTRLRDLRFLLNSVFTYFKGPLSEFSNTMLEHISKEIEFDFYHNKEDKQNSIILSSKLLTTDAIINKQSAKDNFRFNGTFLRGCVRISHR